MTYIPPSQCPQCVPIETLSVHSLASWTVDIAHEPTCPNHPKPKEQR